METEPPKGPVNRPSDDEKAAIAKKPLLLQK